MGEVLYGGPYTHEVDAIRDERLRAARMEEKPNFDTIFAGQSVSAGALRVIEDIQNPLPAVIGPSIDNVVTPDNYLFPADGGEDIVTVKTTSGIVEPATDVSTHDVAAGPNV
jgi:hypothetical protein